MSHLSNSFGAFLLLTVMGGGLAPEVLASSVRPTMTITQQQDALQGVVTTPIRDKQFFFFLKKVSIKT